MFCLPAPCGLNHLIVGAVALVNVSIAETHRHIEAELGYLEALEFR
jgi:hypothetical protein